MIYAHYTGEQETKVRRNQGLIPYLLSGIATLTVLYFQSTYPEFLGARLGLLYPVISAELRRTLVSLFASIMRVNHVHGSIVFNS